MVNIYKIILNVNQFRGWSIGVDIRHNGKRTQHQELKIQNVTMKKKLKTIFTKIDNWGLYVYNFLF